MPALCRREAPRPRARMVYWRRGSSGRRPRNRPVPRGLGCFIPRWIIVFLCFFDGSLMISCISCVDVLYSLCILNVIERSNGEMSLTYGRIISCSDWLPDMGVRWEWGDK